VGHADVALPDPVNELLKELRAKTAFGVLVGRVRHAGSATLKVAIQQARHLAENPTYYASSGSVDMAVTRDQFEALVASGAAHEQDVQIIRSYRQEDAQTFSGRCDQCQRWIWCGDKEHESVCACGHRYRVVFDIAEIDRCMLRRGLCCGDCGVEMGLREWIGGRQPWRGVNEWQVQCHSCNDKTSLPDRASGLVDVERVGSRPRDNDPQS
jgi:hypothetical protein